MQKSEARKILRNLIILAKGGCCKSCYSTEHLQFHHHTSRRRNKKFIFKLSEMDRSLKVIYNEADMCILLCEDCHIEVELGICNEPKLDKPLRSIKT